MQPLSLPAEINHDGIDIWVMAEAGQVNLTETLRDEGLFTSCIIVCLSL